MVYIIVASVPRNLLSEENILKLPVKEITESTLSEDSLYDATIPILDQLQKFNL